MPPRHNTDQCSQGFASIINTLPKRARQHILREFALATAKCRCGRVGHFNRKRLWHRSPKEAHRCLHCGRSITIIIPDFAQ